MSPVKEPTFFAAQDLLTGRLKDDVLNYTELNREGLEAYLDGPMPDRAYSQLVLEPAQYVRLFRPAREQIAIGEASVSYFWLPSAAAAIASTIPDARLVFMLRDPAERAFSQHLASGYYDQHETFRERFVSATTDPASRWWVWCAAGRYGTHLQRFFDHFPREQMLIHLYEDYKTDPQAVLQSIYRFLGVDPSFRANLSRRHNEPAPVRFPRLHALRWRVFGQTNLSRYVPDGLRNVLLRFYLKRRADVRMEPADRQMVIEQFRDEVQRAADLIGRDLSAWLR